MTSVQILPLKLTPAFQNYLWGGQRLRDLYHKPAPTHWQNVAESWELSTHPHGLSKINGGPYHDQTFAHYLEAAGPKILGKRFSQPKLPILIKLIDAMDNLSIQVHPHDDYARKYENSPGKTEMWYIIDAQKDSFIYYGFNQKISANEFEKRIKKQTILEVLQKVPAKKGDVFFIPSGTLHAIGKGLLVAEIQQCCDLTYRIYDYGRLQDGKPRALHLEKALDVTKLDKVDPPPMTTAINLNDHCQLLPLINYKDFIVKKIILDGDLQLLSLPDTYQVLLVTTGQFVLTYQDYQYSLQAGETIFLPADLGTYDLHGQGEILLVTDN